MVCVAGTKRNGPFDVLAQAGAVAQEEEQQIQHDAQADEKLECVLTDIKCLRGQEFASFHGSRGKFVFQAKRVGKAEVGERVMHRLGQGLDRLFEIQAQVELAGGDLLIENSALDRKRTRLNSSH